jgi:hypothetical protein
MIVRGNDNYKYQFGRGKRSDNLQQQKQVLQNVQQNIDTNGFQRGRLMRKKKQV